MLKLSQICIYHINLNVSDECRRGKCSFGNRLIHPKIQLCVFALNWQFYLCNDCSKFSCLSLKTMLKMFRAGVDSLMSFPDAFENSIQLGSFQMQTWTAPLKMTESHHTEELLLQIYSHQPAHLCTEQSDLHNKACAYFPPSQVLLSPEGFIDAVILSVTHSQWVRPPTSGIRPPMTSLTVS